MEPLIKQLPALSYAEWSSRALSRVVLWRYGTRAEWAPDPYTQIVYPDRKSRPLPPRLAMSPGTMGEGLDAKGHVVVTRFFVMGSHNDVPSCYETFYWHQRRVLQWAQFDYHWPDKGLMGFYSLSLDKGQPHMLRYCAKEMYGQKVYLRQGREIVGIDDWRFDRRTGTEGLTKYRVTWDRPGKVRLVTQSHNHGPASVVWKRRQRGESLAQLLSRYRTLLVASIREGVRSLKLTEPAYALVLTFDLGNQLLPPIIGVGLDRERQDWMDRYGAEAWAYVWNTHEFQCGIDKLEGLVTTQARELARMIDQLCTSGRRSKYVVAMLRAAARDLSQVNWAGDLPRTEDFIAIAVHYELDGELKIALLDVMDAQVYRRLREQGLAP